MTYIMNRTEFTPQAAEAPFPVDLDEVEATYYYHGNPDLNVDVTANPETMRLPADVDMANFHSLVGVPPVVDPREKLRLENLERVYVQMHGIVGQAVGGVHDKHTNPAKQPHAFFRFEDVSEDEVNTIFALLEAAHPGHLTETDPLKLLSVYGGTNGQAHVDDTLRTIMRDRRHTPRA